MYNRKTKCICEQANVNSNKSSNHSYPLRGSRRKSCHYVMRICAQDLGVIWKGWGRRNLFTVANNSKHQRKRRSFGVGLDGSGVNVGVRVLILPTFGRIMAATSMHTTIAKDCATCATITITDNDIVKQMIHHLLLMCQRQQTQQIQKQ